VDPRDAEAAGEALKSALLSEMEGAGWFRYWRVSKNKMLEMQISKFPNAWYTFLLFSLHSHGFAITILGLEFEITWRCDHSKVSFEANSPFGHYFGINICDRRHWDERCGKEPKDSFGNSLVLNEDGEIEEAKDEG
jgi:hypothetical protein